MTTNFRLKCGHCQAVRFHAEQAQARLLMTIHQTAVHPTKPTRWREMETRRLGTDTFTYLHANSTVTVK